MNTDRVYLVTGASRGLGAAIVSQLSELGCKVLTTARSEDSLKSLWGGDPNVHWEVSDLSRPAEASRLVESALKKFGRLDGLINNAGTIDPINPLAECDGERWSIAITVNLTAPALLMGAAIPHLRRTGGRVVNISSGAAVKPMQGWSAYCASKAGLLHLTQVAAAEYPEVGFYSLRPGVIDTEMQGEIRNSTGMTADDLAKFKGLKTEGNLEPPEVPARAAVWLALHGPLERSGEFIQYTDEEISTGVKELFSSVQFSGRESNL